MGLIEIAAAGGVFYMAHDTDGHWSQRTLYCIGVVVCLVLLYTLYLGYSLKNRVDLCANMVKVSGIALKSSPCVFVVALAMVCLKFAFAGLCTSAMWVLQQSTLDYWFVEHKEWTSLASGVFPCSRPYCWSPCMVLLAAGITDSQVALSPLLHGAAPHLSAASVSGLSWWLHSRRHTQRYPSSRKRASFHAGSCV